MSDIFIAWIQKSSVPVLSYINMQKNISRSLTVKRVLADTVLHVPSSQKWFKGSNTRRCQACLEKPAVIGAKLDQLSAWLFENDLQRALISSISAG